MNIACVMWNAKTRTFAEAAKDLAPDVSARVVSLNDLENPEVRDDFFAWAESEADLLLAYHSSGAVWADLEEPTRSFGERKPVVSIGRTPNDWSLSNQAVELVAKAQEYMTLDGLANACGLLRFLAREIGGVDVEVPPPKTSDWDGIWDSKTGAIHRTLSDLASAGKSRFPSASPVIGLMFYRSWWTARNLAVVRSVVEALEARGCVALPVFSAGSFANVDTGARNPRKVVEDCFMIDGRIAVDVVLNLRGFFFGDKDDPGVEILKTLNVPVLNGNVAYRHSIDAWRAAPKGIAGNVAMSVSGPEFDGIIEPTVVGAVEKTDVGGQRADVHVPIPDRVNRVADRLVRWAKLRRTPAAKRKVAFILHNSPCASAEATVGGAAKLDSMASLVAILRAMTAAGYGVETPDSGEALANMIMERKAISEFRWTSTAEIVAKGGALDLVEEKRYRKWFDPLPEATKRRMSEAWGEPPGEEKDGVPAAMVHDGKIVISGVKLGNAVVCVQPKRGCAGSRCDGRVCKILHDPTVPPTHQYLATYRWLEDDFGADCVIHVGTHGNLEFLPGKSIGLSNECFPDICLGTLPHLYIYNSDNPPEGVIAKRRGLATLIDHMQTVVTDAGVHHEFEEIERLLAERAKAADTDRARAHQLEHQIRSSAEKAGIDVRSEATHAHPEFDDFARHLHDQLFLLRNSGLPVGMHVFGSQPESDDRVEFLYGIMKHSTPERPSLRSKIANHHGIKLGELLNKKGKTAADLDALALIDETGKRVVRHAIANTGDLTPSEEGLVRQLGDELAKLADVDQRLRNSREIEALLAGLDGCYIPSGPSGLITRGADDVLPTGRNFYALDPKVVPTPAAFAIGGKLSDALVEKFVEDNGVFPENVAIYWMSNDIMWSDGEVMSQILDLIGCEPKWDGGGKVVGFDVIPLEKARRPRIDVTIRVSGITRDNFPCRIDLIDEAIQTVAALDEPDELNFVRKHTRSYLRDNQLSPDSPEDFRQATFRVFAAQPGSYQAGVQLAVHASAWKEEKDLADVFINWNGYAYGNGHHGTKSHDRLRDNLKTVDLTYNKTATDESDLFGCCCFFGAHGGMTAAARNESGKDVKGYYGDSREPLAVDVRSLEDEVRRVVQVKILNPKWIESMKAHGYKGAGDMAKRIGRLYGWEAAAGAVDDSIFDKITDQFVLDQETRQWFRDNNKWAFEEIARRLVEAHERGLWNTDEERWEKLSDAYMEVESWMEEDMGPESGNLQGGSIDVITANDVPTWKEALNKFH